MLTINSLDMPTPSKFYVTLYDVKSKEDRNAAGTSVVDLIATKRRLECEWAYMSRSEMALLLTETAPASFNVNYFDPYDNALKTISCSAGDKSIGVYRMKDGLPVWVNTKMTLSER